MFVICTLFHSEFNHYKQTKWLIKELLIYTGNKLKYVGKVVSLYGMNINM